MEDRPPEGTNVRVATTRDIPTLVDVRESVAREGRWIGRELPLEREAESVLLQAGITNPSDAWFVAEADGRVVGYGGFHPDGHGHGELFMALLQGYRGQGLGGALLAEIIAAARTRPSIHKLVLQAWPHNTVAIALYSRYGFQVEGYLHQHWRRSNGELWDAVVMGRLVRS